jgi:hypothetical protein
LPAAAAQRPRHQIRQVATPLQRTDAEELAQDTPGVKRVVNSIGLTYR